ncbi:capsule assembly Wzi family protein [Siphonobacter sp. SORGH_AS_0500]|uniref:capsule assembly Wzi family protein n=1 Tax=Siphonobacter sp. SORGH_AS_0500 TaxID=1864824 RepID=UPI00285EAFB5|nr:capsule assembly Wzi family protein [Siphonobacter sp. SORGH_AS_0500]MDR6194123.1 hypothetical protein [Siphonobacter sp. SORGH_AS_0500]
MLFRIYLLVLSPVLVHAQGILTNAETYETSVRLTAAGSVPFWMQARQYGVMPSKGSFLQTSFLIHSDYQKPSKTRPYLQNKRLDWGYALEVTGNVGRNPQLFLPQAHLKFKYKNLELYAGKRKELIGIADSTLGMGPYSWSGNAMPVPKIQLGLTQWTSLFTPHLAIQASMAHGWLDDREAYVRRAYLHQKNLYFRFGKLQANVLGFVGINHQVQWAGTSSVVPANTNYFQLDGSLPRGAAAFLSVLTGKRGFGKNYNPYDHQERVGNHLGSVDLALQIQSDAHRICIYRQQPYEMPSLIYLSNLRDGLWGISIHTHATGYLQTGLRNVVFEVLSTQDQGRKGPLWGTKPIWTEQYFNHLQYKQGWSYQGRTIGVPFINPSTNQSYFNNNNLLTVYHLAAEARVTSQWQVTGRLSYLTSRGNPDHLYTHPRQQLCFLIEAQRMMWFLKGSALHASMAGDAGDLYPSSLAFSVSIKKRWGFVDESIPELERYRLRYRR